MDWNNYNNKLSNAVLESDRLRELLHDLGCQNLRGSHGDREFRGPCPVHGGRKHNFLVKNGDKIPIVWACWSRHCHHKYKPSLLGLVRGILSFQQDKPVSLSEAAKYVKKFLGDTPLISHESPSPHATPQPKLWSYTRQQVRDGMVIPSPYFVKRGFSAAILDAMDVGHSARLNRSVVPFYDDTGDVCIGYQARSEQLQCRKCERFHSPVKSCWSAEDKWNILAGFPKGAFLYGYHLALRSDSPSVLLVEGPGDVWAAAAANTLAVACLGTDVTTKQAEILGRLRKHVYVAFDNDQPGQAGALRTVERLKDMGVSCSRATITTAYHDLGEMATDAVYRWLQSIQAASGLSERRCG